MLKRPSPDVEAERLFRELRQEFARKGGAFRAKKLTAERRREIAKKGVAARRKKK